MRPLMYGQAAFSPTLRPPDFCAGRQSSQNPRQASTPRVQSGPWLLAGPPVISSRAPTACRVVALGRNLDRIHHLADKRRDNEDGNLRYITVEVNVRAYMYSTCTYVWCATRVCVHAWQGRVRRSSPVAIRRQPSKAYVWHTYHLNGKDSLRTGRYDGMVHEIKCLD